MDNERITQLMEELLKEMGPGSAIMLMKLEHGLLSHTIRLHKITVQDVYYMLGELQQALLRPPWNKQHLKYHQSDKETIDDE
jgi:hypothetical protein